MSRIVQFAEFGPPSVLRVVEVPDVHPGPGQVRVAAKTFGLNPVDSKLRNGELQQYIPIQPPSGIGNEFAGVVDEVGDGEIDFAVGDEVLGTAPFRAIAEHLVVDASALTRKPDRVSWEVAAGIPIAAVTAYNAFNAIDVGSDDVVLVTAAAGGVGGVAAQLARRAGATVIGTASEANHDYLRSLDIIPITYGPGLVERILQVLPSGITAVLENKGSEGIEAGLELGVPTSKINTVVGNAEQYGVGAAGGSQDAETLAAVAALVSDRELAIPVEAVFAFDDVAAGYQRLDEGHLRGKIIVSL